MAATFFFHFSRTGEDVSAKLLDLHLDLDK